MITKYNNRSLALGIPGFALQVGCLIALVLSTPSPGWAGTLLLSGMVVGHILIIAGFCYYAAAKGHSAILGAIGLFSVFGLFVLAWLPDKSKDEVG